MGEAASELARFNIIFIKIISIATIQVHYYSEALPTQHGYIMYLSEFHAQAPQATASEGLAQGPYTWRPERYSNPRPF